MSRSFIHLRRALFGTSCAIVFGFGATEAFATPQRGSTPPACVPFNSSYRWMCERYCMGLMGANGECNPDTNTCECFF